MVLHRDCATGVSAKSARGTVLIPPPPASRLRGIAWKVYNIRKLDNRIGNCILLAVYEASETVEAVSILVIVLTVAVVEETQDV
jgi:hypothetical protein